MTLPTRDEATQAVRSSSFWTFTIAIWLVMLSTAVTLALGLLIWTIVEAF